MKKIFIKVTSLFICIFFALGLTSCTEVNQAKKSLTKMLDTLKKDEYILARDLYISRMDGDNDFLGCKNKYNEKDFPAYEMHRELFTNMEYKVIETVSEETTKITFLTEFTVVDLEPVADMLFETTEDFNFMADNNETKLTEEEINAVLTQRMIDISREYLASGERKTKTTQLKVNVCFEDDRVWRVYPDDELINVLTGGVYNKYNQLLREYQRNR